MERKFDVFKCESCGMVAEVLNDCSCGPQCSLTCCGQPMRKQAENTVDAAKEKHVPVIEQGGQSVRVKVGSVEHPMKEEHFIEWIEIIQGERTQRKFLRPGEKPEAEFTVQVGPIVAREHCNIHGLWKAQQ